MFTRKHLKRFRRYLVLAVVALVINVAFPTKVHAEQPVLTPEVVGISHTVVDQLTPSQEPTISLTTLPEATDKPETEILRIMTVRASAYTSTVAECDSDPFTTASGAKVYDGGIAMNGIKFGTKIRIPAYFGNKVFTVTDRMNARWGNKKIDIWMTNRTDAINWGVRSVTIEFLS